MRFRVYGVREDTGRAIKPIAVTAADERAAMARARQAGIRVERIEPLLDDAAPPAEPAPPPPAATHRTGGRQGCGLRLATTLALVCISLGLLCHLARVIQDVIVLRKVDNLREDFWLGYSLSQFSYLMPTVGVLIFLSALRAKQ